VVGGDIVARSFHASPNGILTLLSSCVFPPSAPNGRSAIGHFDPAGGALGGISLALPCDGIVRTLASDVRGRIFLLAHDANGIAGMWLDSAGTAITSWFHVGSGGTKQDVLAPLVGGGVGVRVDGVWRYVVASGEAQSQPAPDFLASNPGADLALIRGAHAYALLPRTDSDESELRLYSGSGEFCGSLAFPGRRINTGADGSVIASSGSHFCHKTIWSRLLR